MNKLLNGLTDATNFTVTENGAVAHKSTKSGLMDLFGLGGAYRTRTDADVVHLFKKAYDEDPIYALKCVFYLRDIIEGAGERRFFRVVMKWLATYDTDAVVRNIRFFPELGRWDDLYTLVDTPAEQAAMDFMKNQFALDLHSKTPSLLGKWLKSCNASSVETKRLGNKTRKYFGLTQRQYRKALSDLRGRINVLERLMSAGQWDLIEFDKIPSRAGLIYRNAFAAHDVDRMKKAQEKAIVSYEDFAKDTTTKVNAKALAPYETVSEALKLIRGDMGSYWYSRDNYSKLALDNTQRLMVNKYWDNLRDVFNGAVFNGIAVVDTSGSMVGSEPSAPINVAISLGLYCAEKATGPFAGHYISFASKPQLIKTDGVDFVDKVYRIYKTNLVDNTNIEATFDLILDTALTTKCSQDDLPQNIIVISDQEFDAARRGWGYNSYSAPKETLIEGIRNKWAAYGYIMPNLIFWNCEARQDNFPMKLENGITFVSGFTPAIFEQILKGKSAADLVYDKLNSSRYEAIK